MNFKKKVKINMKKDIWFTIKYKNDIFDVKWSSTDRQIKEIRSIDSEVNITSLLSLEVTREIQDIITKKGTYHAI
jgi:hypothetical protein